MSRTFPGPNHGQWGFISVGYDLDAACRFSVLVSIESCSFYYCLKALIWRSNAKNSGSIPRNACVACETAMRVWQTDRQTDGRTYRQTTDKVIPMCRYASQATQKWRYLHYNFFLPPLLICKDLAYVAMTECPISSEKKMKVKRHTETPQKTIAGRLRKVTWSKYCHQGHLE